MRYPQTQRADPIARRPDFSVFRIRPTAEKINIRSSAFPVTHMKSAARKPFEVARQAKKAARFRGPPFQRHRIKFIMGLCPASGAGSFVSLSTFTIQAMFRPSLAATSMPSSSFSASPGSAPWTAPQ